MGGLPLTNDSFQDCVARRPRKRIGGAVDSPPSFAVRVNFTAPNGPCGPAYARLVPFRFRPPPVRYRRVFIHIYIYFCALFCFRHARCRRASFRYRYALATRCFRCRCPSHPLLLSSFPVIARPMLLPSDLFPTRTSHRAVTAAGTPRPSADHGFG